jgi:hypothetical protein
MRRSKKAVEGLLLALQEKGLAESTTGEDETMWSAAPGASLAKLTGEPSESVGYSGTSSLEQRRLTPAEEDDSEELDWGFL